MMLLSSLPASAACYTELKKSLPDGGIVVFGEVHGTAEMPRFFGSCVQEFLDKRENVAVYLELPATDDTLLARYVRGEMSEESLLRSPHWQTRDGRASVAMLELLRRLKGSAGALHGGAPRGFDGANTFGPAREGAMADNLLATYPAKGYSLVLVGNLHARLSPGVPWDAKFESFALRAKRTEPRLVSLDARYLDGTAWICSPQCGSTHLRASVAGVKSAATPGVNIDRSAANYDGYFNVGNIQSSPPVLEGGVPSVARDKHE